MAIPSRTIKGLQDIRSHFERVGREAIPHRAYMRLSCLEMEKFRRARERESAMARVRNIDARFREIDSEEAIILRGMKELERTGSADVSSKDGGPKKPAPERSGGLKFRY